MAEATTDRNGNVRVGSAANEWTPPRGRKRWQLVDGEGMVAALRASGETPAAFARRHGLHDARVQRWVGRVGTKSRPAAAVSAVAFAPVRVIAERPTGSGLEVVVGGAVVRIARGFDDELLRRVVATLGAASC